MGDTLATFWDCHQDFVGDHVYLQPGLQVDPVLPSVELQAFPDSTVILASCTSDWQYHRVSYSDQLESLK